MKIKILQSKGTGPYVTVAECDSAEVATKIMMAIWPDGGVQAWTAKRGTIGRFIYGFTETGAVMQSRIGETPLVARAK